MDLKVDLHDFMHCLGGVRFEVRHVPVFAINFFFYRIHAAAEVFEFIDASCRGAGAEGHQKGGAGPDVLYPLLIFGPGD